MSLMTEVKSLLTSISNVFIGNMPTTPDDVIAIYNTGGYPRGLTESKLKQPTFQIRIRSASYAAGEVMCNTVADLLHGNGTTKILTIYQQGDPLDLGRDQNNRSEFSINFRCYYKQ